MTLHPDKTYYVYRWHQLGNAPVSKLRNVGQVWAIPGWQTKTKAELRWAIMGHANNKSSVPHPLITVPVEL